MPDPSSYYGTGRRKQAVARVWIFPDQKGLAVNGQDHAAYLKRTNLRVLVEEPLKAVQLLERFRVRAEVRGGGIAGQAGAIQLGIARALLSYDGKLRPVLRHGGFLTRDPREKERKKFGHKGARRSFQYTKR